MTSIMTATPGATITTMIRAMIITTTISVAAAQ